MIPTIALPCRYGSMQAYRVTHKKSGERYFLLADSAAHAIEIVEMKIGDPEQPDAWETATEAPGFELRHSTVYDGDGKALTQLI